MSLSRCIFFSASHIFFLLNPSSYSRPSSYPFCLSSICNKWGTSSSWTEVGLRRSSEVAKGEQGWNRSGQRRYSLMDGQQMEREEWGMKKRVRQRDDWELLFHFPLLWHLDDEGHYSHTQSKANSVAHNLPSFFVLFFMGSPSLCLSLNAIYYVLFYKSIIYYTGKCKPFDI